MNALRSLRRNVAHSRMKKKGYCRVNKRIGNKSYFAKHWREV